MGPPPEEPIVRLGSAVWTMGPRGVLFPMREVPLYLTHKTSGVRCVDYDRLLGECGVLCVRYRGTSRIP